MTTPLLFSAVALATLLVIAVRQGTKKRLLKTAPSAYEEAIIQEVLRPYSPQILEYRNSLVLKAGTVRHVDLHLVVPGMMTVRMAQQLRRVISGQISQRLGGNSLMVHIESCRLDCSSCREQGGALQYPLQIQDPGTARSAPASLAVCPYRQ